MEASLPTKTPNRPGRDSDQFIVRLPGGMRDRISAMAARQGRSMNSEVVDALEKHIEADEELWDLAERVERLEDIVKGLDGVPATAFENKRKRK